MPYFKNNLCNEMLRLFTSPAFYIGIIAIVISLFLSCITEITTIGHEREDVLYYFWVAHWQGFQLMLLVVASLGAVNYCIDSKTKYDRYIILRSSRKSYVVSKLVACELTAVITTVLGEILFILLLLTFLPLSSPSSPTFESRAALSPYGIFLQSGQHVLYLTAFIVMLFFRSCMFSMFSLMTAVKTRNVFVTLSIPVILYYVVIGLAHNRWIPPWLNLFAIFEGVVFDQSVMSLAYSITACTVLILSFMAVSYCMIEKRLLNE